MLRALRLRLTLLSTVLTGAVLVSMALAAFSLASGQLRQSGQAAFQTNLNTVVTKLQTDRVLSLTWLAQTEAAEGLVISLTDAGVPLRFSGSWTPETDRSVLLDRAAGAGRALGVDPDTAPLSALEVTSATFEVAGDHADRYLGAVAVIPVQGGWQGLVLLKDMGGADRQSLLLRLAFAVLVAAGMAVLCALCWVFSGRAIRPIEESRKRQAEFVAAASHELRSPLAVIRAGTAAMEAAPEEFPRLRATLDAECVRMARLVDDLLALARSDADAWSMHWETVDVDTLLLETAERFCPVARQKGLALRLEVPDVPLPPVSGDGQRLGQLLSVLLDNACSYTPAGGTLTLSASSARRWLSLRLADTGPGIPPEHLPHIFERFYRADAARSGKEHFGLGLSIAAELARLHRGSLRVASSGPAGTTFELRLPIDRAAGGPV